MREFYEYLMILILRIAQEGRLFVRQEGGGGFERGGEVQEQLRDRGFQGGGFQTLGYMRIIWEVDFQDSFLEIFMQYYRFAEEQVFRCLIDVLLILTQRVSGFIVKNVVVINSQVVINR